MPKLNVIPVGKIADDPRFRVDYNTQDDELHIGHTVCRVMVTADTDLANIPDGLYSPGTTAFLADGSGSWVLDADGMWNAQTSANEEEEETEE